MKKLCFILLSVFIFAFIQSYSLLAFRSLAAGFEKEEDMLVFEETVGEIDNESGANSDVVSEADSGEDSPASQDKKFIKWVDFNCSAEILDKVYQLDMKTKKSEVHFDFISTLSYIALKNGNNFNIKRDTAVLNKLVASVQNGQKLQDVIPFSNKYYNYYYSAYTAIFAKFMGIYTTDGETYDYGLLAYHPLAAGYWHTGADDFGNSRSFGFKRRHLGHDLFGSTGTPVIAVEGGTITELGWNYYGGWRIGIRSHDQKRYYYYAHLRKDVPYAENLKNGDNIEAGEVIGYLGCTGYGRKENKNMSGKPHLHFGLQLIFDKSQEDGNGEIWIDVYNICRFLYKNKAKTVKQENKHRISVDLRKGVDELPVR